MWYLNIFTTAYFPRCFVKVQFSQHKYWLFCCCVTLSCWESRLFSTWGKGLEGGQAVRDTRDVLSGKEVTVAEMKRRLQAMWNSLATWATTAEGLFPFPCGWLSVLSRSQESPSKSGMEKGKEREPTGMEYVPQYTYANLLNSEICCLQFYPAHVVTQNKNLHTK